MEQNELFLFLLLYIFLQIMEQNEVGMKLLLQHSITLLILAPYVQHNVLLPIYMCQCV